MQTRKRPWMNLVGLSAILIILLLALPKLSRFSKGSIAISALIIFIALVLVAAIAASVLISTGGSLQQKALITGNEVREGISSGFDPVSIRGSDASSTGTPHRLTNLYVMGRLPAGASPLSLNNTVLTYDGMSVQTLNFGGTVADSVLASDTMTFVVSYVKSGPYQEDGYINLGDMARLKFTVDGYVGENTRGRITIVPMVGNPTTLEFLASDSLTQQVEVLWPMS